jgi:aminoglycoside/choline kinase family phosphotransferase
MDLRQQALIKWIEAQLPISSIEPMAGDASFRRYFRMQSGQQSFVAMDAPPPGENCAPFVAIAGALASQGVSVPLVHASDLVNGFLLLTDCGATTLLQHLNADNAEKWYQIALDALSELQSCSVDSYPIPLFSPAFIVQELALFKHWFLQMHLQLSLTTAQETDLDDFFNVLASSANDQPQVLMHRDYHAANLMVLPNDSIAILDFQDAFIGPVTYDLVSLLRDCYVAWPAELVTRLARYYKAKLFILQDTSDELFLKWFDLMGLQRHLKALLTFSRKHHRDKNSHYLQYIPRTLQYLSSVSQQHPECQAFYTLLQTSILPAANKVASCAQ